MLKEAGFDPWEDKYEPSVYLNATVYFLRLSNDAQQGIPYVQRPHVYVEVDVYGLVSITNYNWFGNHSSKGITYEVTHEILEWLQEWELVELRAIGPEDSEWFATDKLTNGSHSIKV